MGGCEVEGRMKESPMHPYSSSWDNFAEGLARPMPKSFGRVQMMRVLVLPVIHGKESPPSALLPVEEETST